MKDNAFSGWSYIEATTLLQCPIFSIDEEKWAHESENCSGNFYVMDVQDWVVAMALNSLGELAFVRQFRFGSRSLTWEFPGGLLEAGESAQVGAQRELLEETGFLGRKGLELGVTFPNPAVQRNRCHYFLFEELVQIHGGEPDPHEHIDLHWVGYDAAMSMVEDGTINHGVVLGGLFLLERFFKRNGQG